jgi:hypothetical protein
VLHKDGTLALKNFGSVFLYSFTFDTVHLVGAINWVHCSKNAQIGQFQSYIKRIRLLHFWFLIFLVLKVNVFCIT